MTACGPLSGSSKTETATTTTAAFTELTITVQPEGAGGPTRTWTLRCDPTGGSHPRAAAACAQVSAAALRALPPGTICTQIYGGPQTARVRGRVEGKPVDARFSRTNGCEIHRWDSVGALFPVKI
jgi:Subtilisin inhibitor-like